MVYVNQQSVELLIDKDGSIFKSVDLGGLSNVNFLSVRAVGVKIRVRITSADGTNQSIPVDPILVLRSDSVNITALDLTRLANTETEVYIVLAERA